MSGEEDALRALATSKDQPSTLTWETLSRMKGLLTESPIEFTWHPAEHEATLPDGIHVRLSLGMLLILTALGISITAFITGSLKGVVGATVPKTKRAILEEDIEYGLDVIGDIRQPLEIGIIFPMAVRAHRDQRMEKIARQMGTKALPGDYEAQAEAGNYRVDFTLSTGEQRISFLPDPVTGAGGGGWAWLLLDGTVIDPEKGRGWYLTKQAEKEGFFD